MKKLSKIFLLLLFVAFFVSCSTVETPKIIFDTDIGGDADDLGALAMLHHLQSAGECELLAVMCWSTERYAVPAIDAVNRFYGHPDIPIGVRKEGPSDMDWNYNRPIAEAFEHELSYEDAAEVASLYREILAGSEDSSVVIVTVGPLANIKYLLDSPADEISAMDGKALVHEKVKEFVIMGGQFPEGENEWNFNGNMPGVTAHVLEHIELPVTFTGFEVGVAIKTGAIFNEALDETHPLYVGFKHFSAHAPWMKDGFKGEILDNSTFDQTAILYAVRKGVGTYWDRVEGGYCLADSTGGNRWVEGAPGPHSYLKLKNNERELEELIESLMLGR
jgi:inosine-uridine nucleoside N-ribohydrolase